MADELSSTRIPNKKTIAAKPRFQRNMVVLIFIFILIFILAHSAVAQTKIYGKSSSTPIDIYGDPTVLNAATIYTRIYVVFPPEAPGTNNTNFVANVMTQSAIDGVTIEVPWNLIENSLPSQTDCTSSSPPDQCQPDVLATGWFHTYSWSTFDNSGTGVANPCAAVANTSSQWFCDFPNGSDSFKKVNFELFGIGGGPGNGITPAYVTTDTAYVSATGNTVQDVVNSANSSTCTGAYAGTNTIPVNSTFASNGANPSIVTVTWHGASSPFVNGDIIWVSGVGSGFDVTGVLGQQVYNVGSSLGNGTFQYTANGIATGTVTVTSTSNITVVNSTQSWPIPYEAPYSGAWQAFLQAAMYHFNTMNHVRSGVGTPPPWNLQQTTSQIAYIRPGVARGGEAIPLCSTSLPMTMPTSPSPAYSPGQWETWYTTVNSTVQSTNPLMQIMYSINAGDPATPNLGIANKEAQIAVAHSNSTGLYNGFGSQGLSQYDITNYPMAGDGFQVGSCPGTIGAPNTANNWGCLFTQYWSGSSASWGATPTTVPLELQQIDCSDPTPTFSGGSGSCFQGGFPGKTLDLRTLYPFATSHYASILELYSQDALLAFDTNFCHIIGPPFSCSTTAGDTFGTSLSPGTQYNFFITVGQGQCTGSGCYSAAIDAAHGSQ